MSRTHLLAALSGALLVGLGVVLGSTLLAARPPSPAAEPATTAVVEAPVNEGARLGARPTEGDVSALRLEVAGLERRIAALEEAAVAERESLKPIRELYEAWKEREPELAELAAADPGALTDMDVEVGLPHGPGVARALASSLELDGARRKAFEAEVDVLMDELRKLEDQHAEVTVDGDTTTIKIPSYPADGGVLERRWKDWVSANLTPEEQDRLQMQGATGKLFGSRLGSFDRRITIRESGGGIQVREVATAEDGTDFQTEVHGPAQGREFVLQEYLHLLD